MNVTDSMRPDVDEYSIPPREDARVTALPLDVDACTTLIHSERWKQKVRQEETRGYVWAKKVREENGCLLWIGTKVNGYGSVWLAGRNRPAHRVAFVAHHQRDITPGLVIDHICRRRDCIHPEHLREVTIPENTLAEGSLAPTFKNMMKTHCPRGHSLMDPENLVEAVKKRGWRNCRTCAQESAKAHAETMAGAAYVLGLTTRQYTAAFGQSKTVADKVFKAVWEKRDPYQYARDKEALSHALEVSP